MVMRGVNRREFVVLLIGDLVSFGAALWLALLARAFAAPSLDVFYNHLLPFSLLFLLSVMVFFIAGLYDKHTMVLKGALRETILTTQIVNVVIAALFFFFIPTFGITPKITLVLYLLISSGLILLWRLWLFSLIRSARRYGAILVGEGPEYDDLYREINTNTRYSVRFLAHYQDRNDGREANRSALRDRILTRLEEGGVQIIVIDTEGGRVEELIPGWYELILRGVRFVDVGNFYEDIFERIPLSFVRRHWFFEQTFKTATILYEAMKAIVDYAGAFAGLILTFPFSLPAAALIALTSPGPLFIFQERIGQSGRRFRLIKFRTMLFDDKGDPALHQKNRVTPIGRILRRARIDEFPQFLNVLRGDLSLSGPRPEIPKLTKIYERDVPYYHLRHLVKPGVSGWAQIKDQEPPKGAADIEKTGRKLSYDLYYIKHRSLALDLHIALKTIRTLLSRSGV